jgi:hypothetical protein
MSSHCKDRPSPPKQKIANTRKVIWCSEFMRSQRTGYRYGSKLCHSRESSATVPLPNLDDRLHSLVLVRPHRGSIPILGKGGDLLGPLCTPQSHILLAAPSLLDSRENGSDPATAAARLSQRNDPNDTERQTLP